jgi:hypothetical protein
LPGVPPEWTQGDPVGTVTALLDLLTPLFIHGSSIFYLVIVVAVIVLAFAILKRLIKFAIIVAIIVVIVLLLRAVLGMPV